MICIGLNADRKRALLATGITYLKAVNPRIRGDVKPRELDIHEGTFTWMRRRLLLVVWASATSATPATFSAEDLCAGDPARTWPCHRFFET
jgi:hypothetical protein